MYDNIQSETRSIKCRVRQGSIFCPLLFIIYMNDICNVSELLYTIMYADDTSVIIVVFFSLIALCYCSRATPFDYVNVNKLSTLYIRRHLP